jgi:hypothetical protein
VAAPSTEAAEAAECCLSPGPDLQQGCSELVEVAELSGLRPGGERLRSVS